MNRIFYTIALHLIIAGAYSQSDLKKDSLKKIEIFHETIGIAAYHYIINFSEREGYTKNSLLYLTGGVGYNLNKKWSVSINYWYNKVDKTINTSSPLAANYLTPYSYALKKDGGFGFIYNYEAYKINSQKRYIWLSATRHIKNINVSLGIGYGSHLYDIMFFNNYTAKEKINNWIAVLDLSYRWNIKNNFYLEPNIGVYSEYYYKGTATSYFVYEQNWFQQELMSKGTQYSINSYNDIKEINYPTPTSIEIKYKYLGLLRDMYYPRVGVRFGIKL